MRERDGDGGARLGPDVDVVGGDAREPAPVVTGGRPHDDLALLAGHGPQDVGEAQPSLDDGRLGRRGSQGTGRRDGGRLRN